MKILSTRYKINDDSEVEKIHRVILTKFELVTEQASEKYRLFFNWFETNPQGIFLSSRTLNDPTFELFIDQETFGTKCAVISEVTEKTLLEYLLRFDKS